MMRYTFQGGHAGSIPVALHPFSVNLNRAFDERMSLAAQLAHCIIVTLGPASMTSTSPL